MRSKPKKPSPRNRPATQADVIRARSEAVRRCWAILFTVLRDKEGYDNEALQRLWGHVTKLSEEIVERRIDVDDLVQVLRDEAGVRLE